MTPLISFLMIVAVLWGLSQMSRPETAVRGNRLGALTLFVAIAFALASIWQLPGSLLDVWVAMSIGLVLGLILAYRVQMIQMPQLVALLNGFGGLASMLVGLLGLLAARSQGTGSSFANATAGLAILVGGLTSSGSAVAAAKLHRLMDQRPRRFVLHGLLSWGSLALALVMVASLSPLSLLSGAGFYLKLLLLTLSSLLFGLALAFPVGGADMPITISLLNSFSGVAAGIAGMAHDNLLLIAVGGVVGASGLLLTQIMCRAMNRSLISILFSQEKKAPAPPKASAPTAAPVQAPSGLCPAERLAAATRVILVPGYGMALSQAQASVKALSDQLMQDGKAVDFAIHPVAGRMPGHMNVLLAEVDIPYEQLREMDEMNPEFKDTDLCLVIGANDVINPAAKTAEGTPLYGMPILNVHEARHVLILNFDQKPGYAGVENPLYQAEPEKVSCLFGDAKASLQELLADYQALKRETPSSQEDSLEAKAKAWLEEAQSLILVPGYGMALSQAQAAVKALSDQLMQDGKAVDFAIHPVAGRMPGHMNVLLAEVDIPYEQLREMDEMNPQFKDTDLALVIGANDVINPAAKTAEGTPLYGMPILNVHEAKRVLILNFDRKPGYAGVENPLYAADPAQVLLIEGDAKESLQGLLAASPQSQAPAPRSSSTPLETAKTWLEDAQSLILVPGYGMALSQAQAAVKALADRFEAAGKSVAYAIHPVAGRMPGHMNVLLAEVDVPYEQLREMDEMNPEFKDTDLCLVIGANDVINPAAKTAEGTPLYGMPILDVAEAKRVLILNVDRKPGYAGVENPLYAADPSQVLLIEGDAKESLQALL